MEYEELEEFQQYNPVSIGIVVHVKESIKNKVRDEIIKIVSRISFDDIVYFHYKNNDNIYLNRGVSVGNISNNDFKNDFILTDAIRKTIKVIKEEDYETKKIIVITDSYNIKMNHSLKMILKYIKSNCIDINFNFVTINSKENIEFLENNFKFKNLLKIEEISESLIGE